jgi:hypothetical protein
MGRSPPTGNSTMAAPRPDGQGAAAAPPRPLRAAPEGGRSSAPTPASAWPSSYAAPAAPGPNDADDHIALLSRAIAEVPQPRSSSICSGTPQSPALPAIALPAPPAAARSRDRRHWNPWEAGSAMAHSTLAGGGRSCQQGPMPNVVPYKGSQVEILQPRTDFQDSKRSSPSPTM